MLHIKRDNATRKAVFAFVPKKPMDDESQVDKVMRKNTHLIPKLPPWKYTNCLSFDDWFDVYEFELLRMFQDFETDLELITAQNDYDISYDSNTLFWNFAHYMYTKSENVKKAYPHFMNNAYEDNKAWMNEQWAFWDENTLRLFQEINNKTHKRHDGEQ